MELNKRSPFMYQSTHRLLLLVKYRVLLFNSKMGVSGKGRTSKNIVAEVKQPLLSEAEIVKSVSSMGNTSNAMLSMEAMLGLSSHVKLRLLLGMTKDAVSPKHSETDSGRINVGIAKGSTKTL